ncbi:hypothetical protein CDL15_Pgr005240 [Punica granatum]|nr:hypothetical protein CDL15_Pgr005240 [Punica granatum]
MVRFARDETIHDTFEGIELKWKFVTITTRQAGGSSEGLGQGSQETNQSFKLSFEKKQKDKIIGSYVPSVIEKSSDFSINDSNALKKSKFSKF